MKSEHIRDLPALVDRAWREAEVPLFWGHRAERDGWAGRGCLSQWWGSSFLLDGVRYPTAEHYMMAEKARLFGDDEALLRILSAPKSRRALSIGCGE